MEAIKAIFLEGESPTLIGNSNVLAGNIFVYQLFVEKVHTYVLLKNGR